MALDIFHERGVPLERQVFTWRDLVRTPISKLDDDAFTRVRIILMNGLETFALRLGHPLSWMNDDLRRPLAQMRRIEKHQQTLVNWLLPPDLSPLETTIAYEQVAIEVTASVAQHEPDPYLAQVYRFGLLEDFDHMHRFSALLDRLEGKDANNILQSYTDIRPGRPTAVEHRAPEDDLREHYDRTTAAPLTKLHAITLTGAEFQTEDYYMNIGPLFADPLARQLYAEISAIEEQHVTQYGSLMDPNESPLERWMLMQATEVYNYYSCAESESNPRVREIWTRFVDYELGQLHATMELFKALERRDPAEVLPESVPEPIAFESHREFVRQTLAGEVDLRARGTQFVDKSQEGADSPSVIYRDQMNSEGSPSELVAAGYRWRPGTELSDGRAKATQQEVGAP
ncbi:MAG: hypothetical protein BGO98_36380 [Myxococcales bacterium 68-20]|nr:hypothetical protein [Myxococcales bacterium]OJY26062.1 MAG: hypothetical protein BGO98_36380 [Myxococcales bacterium 68-20]